MANIEAYHRRFRPKALTEYIGNTKLKKSVFDMLKNNARPQVILLQGHSGCGKTTMARLLAKEYNCEHRDEQGGACGDCEACRMFDEYIESGSTDGLMNLWELHSGKIGKAEAEVVMADMEAPSYDGGWKTFIFDECHLLTAGAMGGLLKMVEEPPDKVLIIFCTTDPDKMLATLISRCQYTLVVQKPTREELCPLLANICKAEGLKYEDKALSLICTSGDYVPRDTLTALESVVRAKGNVLYSSAVEVLNVIADTYYFKFYDLVSASSIDIFAYIAFLGELREQLSLTQFIDGLIAFTKRGIYVYNGIKVDGLDSAEMKLFKKIFMSFNTGDIAYILETLIKIQKSPDIEVQLMLLGYTGVRKPKTGVYTNPNNDDSLKADLMNTAAGVAREQQMGTQTRNAEGEVTKEEVNQIVTSATSEVNEDALLGMFNVVKFEGNVTDFT